MPRSAPFLTIFSFALALKSPAAEEVLFNRDVRPILAEKCFSCHGFDPKHREGDLRLDTFEGATADNEGFRAIVPGDLAKSEAWLRITTTDEEEIMPPKKSHKVLDAKEKAVLKKWIEQGAKYQQHWAFETPVKAALPAVKKEGWSRNAIDRFVLAGLESAGLEPAPETDRRTLARRVYLDLTGLPPAPEEVDAFAQDQAPDAYEKLVARLLNSPQWGEHRGRAWLDAARYADTHGLHFDNYREMWAFRDWVIGAFNRNLPFDQFTIEQLAGDLLPQPTRDQLIATGFQRSCSTTNEGGTIDEENLSNYANDRATTTSWVWLGLSANCAACHDHKFDPILQKDFYAMTAFFRNTTQPAKDGNVKDSKPVLYLPQGPDEARMEAVTKELAEVRAKQGQRRAELEKEFEPWLAKAKIDDLEVLPAKLQLRALLNEGQGDEVKVDQGETSKSIKASAPLAWKDGGQLGKAPAFEKDAQIELGGAGDFERDQRFSAGAWVKVPNGLANGAILARFDDRGDRRQGWVLFFEGGKFGVRLASNSPRSEVRVLSTKPQVKAGQWQHVLFTYDGSRKARGVALYVNGKSVPVNAPAPPAPAAGQVATPNGELLGSMRTEVPLRLARREVGAPFAGGQVQDVRIFSDTLAAREVSPLPQEKKLRDALAAADKRTPEQKKVLRDFYLEFTDPQTLAMADRVDDLTEEDTAIKARAVVTFIQEERKDKMPMAHILMRGEYDKQGAEVTPGGFSSLHPMTPEMPKNRLGLAQWLMAKENPLTARVTVNRFWQEVFGTGLVRTSEDFGTMGDRPSNQDLLDWLSVEFRESGWDVKKLFTLIVTSSTYRQSAAATPLKLERDLANRMFSRGPRFRMDAEMVRDYALAASGLLVNKLGGPSVKPYQPEGVWEAVAMRESNTRNYKRDSGEALYRRSLYTFWKRAAPPALMDVFNAPSRESCTVRRERTNTPLQALAMLNDPQFVEASRKLAEAAYQKTGGRMDAAVDWLAQRALLRPLSAEEKKVVTDTYKDLERQFAENPAGAAELLKVGDAKSDPALPAPPFAALTMIANQLLSLDEAINK